MATETGVPARKVITGAAVGAFVTVVTLILNTYVPFFKAQPIDGTLAAAVTTFLSFVAGYLTPPAESETSIKNEDGNMRSATKN